MKSEGVAQPTNDLLCGVNPILEALRAGLRPFQRIYVARGRAGQDVQEILTRCREKGIPLQFEDRDVLNGIGRGTKHQGVIGLVAAKSYATVEAILDRAAQRAEDPLLLILCGIEDPRNLGAIIRTAEAGGVHGVIVPERRSVGLNETVAKTSAGALDHLPVARVGNIRQTVDSMKSLGIWVMALDPMGETGYSQMDYHRPMALLVGGEGQGVGPSLLRAADARLSIPMVGRVASLNVSVAVGILVFEVHRSRVGRGISR